MSVTRNTQLTACRSEEKKWVNGGRVYSHKHRISSFHRLSAHCPLALRRLALRPVSEYDRQQAGIESDWIVDLASQQRARLPILLRCITLRREDGRLLTILSNDIGRPAAEIAALYRKRWQIELLFRWIKQHLKIRSFLGRSENAIRLQIFAAMIAYLLLRIAARTSRSGLLALRFADLVRTRLFERRPVAAIDKPPEAAPPYPDVQNQLGFAYA